MTLDVRLFLRCFVVLVCDFSRPCLQEGEVCVCRRRGGAEHMYINQTRCGNRIEIAKKNDLKPEKEGKNR